MFRNIYRSWVESWSLSPFGCNQFMFYHLYESDKIPSNIVATALSNVNIFRFETDGINTMHRTQKQYYPPFKSHIYV